MSVCGELVSRLTVNQVPSGVEGASPSALTNFLSLQGRVQGPKLSQINEET